MIFDDLDFFKESNASESHYIKKTVIETSIDNYWQERKQRLEKRDLTDLYRHYKLAINENFFKLEKGNRIQFSNRHKKINKLCERSLNVLESRVPSGIYPLKSQNCISMRQNNNSKTILESIKEIENDDMNNLKKENFKSAKENGCLNLKNKLCSMHEIDKYNFSQSGFNGQKENAPRDLNKNDQWSRENISTIKSLESLDEMNYKKTEPSINFDQKCPICMKNFGIKAEIAVTVACSHVFHETCFKKWIKKNCDIFDEKCPKCLKKL